MKKIILLSGLVVLTLASCKKERTCECSFTSTIYMNGTPSSSTTTDDVKTEKLNKKDAEKKCESMNATITSGDTQVASKTEATCKLKN